MSAQNLWYDLKTGDFPVDSKVFKIRGGNGHILCWGEGAPTESSSGYCPGCIYIDITNTTLYVNQGTASSADWYTIDTTASP